MKPTVASLAATLVVAAGPATPAAPQPAAASTPKTYAVDCTAGRDRHSGSMSAPWRTLTRADAARLRPGQRLLLRRGCTWTGQRLDAAWHGTAAAPVKIGAYGSGPDPVITNGRHADVQITGTWQVISHISATVRPTKFTACGEPVGDEYGFNLQPGARHNTIQYSQASRSMAGIHLAPGADHNRIEHNVLSHNNMVTGFHRNPSQDLGAWGILVDSDDNDIGWNTFTANLAVCSNQGYQRASNSVELYTAAGNSIHDNRSVGDRVFSELGSSPRDISANNTYSYNIFVSGVAHARFVTTRGALDHVYGPVRNTVLYHNTTYETGTDGQAVVCSSGCNAGILTLNSNLLWADTKVLYADRAVADWRNLFWSSTRRPVRQAPGLSSSNIVANPRFVNAAAGNFRVKASSPAVSVGRNNGDWGVDVYGARLPDPPAALTIGAAQ